MKLKNRNVDIATVKILLVALVLCMSNPLSYAESHKIPVVVLLKQRPDIDALYLSVESVPRDDRATIVWEYLASLSISSQKNLISFLKEKMSVGQVSYIRPIRICNAIAIEADQQLIEELKLRDDVHKLIDNFPRKSEAESLLTQEQETLPNTELDEVAFNLQRIHIQHAWDDGYLGQGILLANIDTGVDYNMPDLADHLWDGGEEYPNHGFNFHAAYFEGDSLDPMDEDGHGTATSGVALGDGTNGIITGVAPEATLMILKVRGDMGTGVVAAAWEAHDFVLAHGVDVTSMSLGWSQPGEGEREVWRANYEILNAAGIVNVKSAGNLGAFIDLPGPITVPGDVPSPWRNPDEVEQGGRGGLIAVGALDSVDIIASWSSNGPVSWQNIPEYGDYPYDEEHVGMIKPDLCAPGKDVYTITLNGYIQTMGTSVACPHVSGLTAVLLSKDNNLLPVQIDSLFQITAEDFGEDGKDNVFGAGKIRADQAIDAVFIPVGTLQGVVRNVNSGEPLENVLVEVVNRPRRSDSTDVQGNFEIEVSVGVYQIKATLPPLDEFYVENVVIEEDETTIIDINMIAGELQANREQFTYSLPPDTSHFDSFRLSNAGSDTLNINLSILPVVDTQPEFLEEQYNFDLAELMQPQSVSGVCYTRPDFYIAAEVDERYLIYQLNQNGMILDSFDQPVEQDAEQGLTCLDVSTDTLWGASGDRIIGFSRTTGEFVRELTITDFDIYSLTFDSLSHTFWIAAQFGDLVQVDANTGEELNRVENESLVRGISMNPFSRDQYQLLVAVENRNLRHLFEVDITSGHWQSLGVLYDEDNRYISGIALVNGFPDYQVTIAGILHFQNNIDLHGWFFRPGFKWVSLVADSISLIPGAEEDISLFVNTYESQPGEYLGSLYAQFNGFGEEITLPISIEVEGTSVAQSNDILVSDFQLNASWPNPFNSSIQISYTIPKVTTLSLHLFDLLGREVFHEYLGRKEPGRYLHQLTLENIGSGLYFLTLETSDQNRVIKKITLIR